jgi:hypothetical protein
MGPYFKIGHDGFIFSAGDDRALAGSLVKIKKSMEESGVVEKLTLLAIILIIRDYNQNG